MTWQPIETAPRDGGIILLSDGLLVVVGCWSPDCHGEKYPWAFVDDFSPYDLLTGDVGVAVNAFFNATHWMPLPEPPEETQ